MIALLVRVMLVLMASSRRRTVDGLSPVVRTGTVRMVPTAARDAVHEHA